MMSAESSVREPRRSKDDFSQALHVGEYLLAALVAVLLFSALSVVQAVVARGTGPVTTSEVLQVAWLTLAVGFFAALFPGLPLAIGTHFAVRRSTSEAVHVAAFAAVGVLTASIFLGVLHLLDSQLELWLMIAETGTATAIARFAVGRVHLTRREAA